MKQRPLYSFFFLFLLSGTSLFSQEDEPAIRLARQLDSIAREPAVSSHFARLYTETVLLSLRHYQDRDPVDKDFIRRFEETFAGFFFHAVMTNGRGQESAAWYTYFRDSSRTPLQYQLMGINAHINADLSAALIKTFTKEELILHRKEFLGFQHALRSQFFRFYEANIGATGLTRILGTLPFGLTRSWGSVMMRKWRRRQFRIAMTHFTNPGKSARLLRKTNRAKERTDRLILRHL